MSLFNWFSGKPKSRKNGPTTVPPDNDSSSLIRDDRTRPTAGVREKDSLPAAKPLNTAAERNGQKSHRHAKREQLYAAVREAMIRAGVLSASYKFKVLSLDPRGDQFMVMMDLAQEFIGQTERLAEIEVMIAQGAKSRYSIRVTAVYWRMNEMVTVSRPRAGNVLQAAQPVPRPEAAQPAIAARVPAVAMAEATVMAAAVAAPAALQRYEPLQADEVNAFKQALAAASAQGTSLGEPVIAASSIARSYTLLTGFEDTEMPESPAASPALSATQYGDLI